MDQSLSNIASTLFTFYKAKRLPLNKVTNGSVCRVYYRGGRDAELDGTIIWAYGVSKPVTVVGERDEFMIFDRELSGSVGMGFMIQRNNLNMGEYGYTWFIRLEN